MKPAIVTDSNSGITQDEAQELGISVVPMPFLIDGEQYFEGISLTQSQFYEKLDNDATVSTSQPSAYDVAELWSKLLKEHEEIVHIPMSGGLSQTCATLTALAEREFAGKVYVVDNHRISVPMRASVMDAIKLADEGKSAKEIHDFLIETQSYSSIYIMVDTLKYLKKGGRLTPAAAAIGTLLKIKPVLSIKADKLDAYAKVRKLSEAKATMIKALENDLDTHFKELRAQGKMALAVAHTKNDEEAARLCEELKARFPDMELFHCDPLALSIACHTGGGALGCGCVFRY